LELNKGQTRGMIVIVVGFVIAIIAGISLSFLAVEVLSTSQVLIAGVIVFVIVSPLFAYGVYTYARSTEADAYATNEEMEKPRQLLDILREKGQGEINELANQLETTPENIKSYIKDLSDLALISGIVDNTNGVIAVVNPMVIEAIETCKTCGDPLEITGNLTVCEHCGTEYYKI